MTDKLQELEAARNLEPDCDYGAVGAGRYTREPELCGCEAEPHTCEDSAGQTVGAITTISDLVARLPLDHSLVLRVEGAEKPNLTAVLMRQIDEIETEDVTGSRHTGQRMRAVFGVSGLASEPAGFEQAMIEAMTEYLDSLQVGDPPAIG